MKLATPYGTALTLGALWLAAGAVHPQAADPRPVQPERAEWPTEGMEGDRVHHSPSLLSTPQGMALAWISGTTLHHPDTEVLLSLRVGQDRDWTAGRTVARPRDRGGALLPCLSAALFQPSEGPAFLFYRTPAPGGRVEGWYRISADSGGSWSEPRSLPRSQRGPGGSPPLELPGGRILWGSGGGIPPAAIRVERAEQGGRGLWAGRRGRPLGDPGGMAPGEPALLDHGGGRLQMLAPSSTGRVAESWSLDGGASWTDWRPTSLPSPGTGLAAARVARETESGRRTEFALLYQHLRQGANQLHLAFSGDGRIWRAAARIELPGPDHFLDPAIVQGGDGLLHLAYSVNHQRIKYVALDPGKLASVPMVGEHWPF